MHKLTGKQVAIKLYDRTKFMRDAAMMRQLKREEKLMATLNHPNVTKLFETFETARRSYIVMEFCAGGNLIDYMRKKYAGQAMPEAQARALFLPLFRGLKHMHDLNIVHRDIKLDNILINEPLGRGGVSGVPKCLKLMDLGFSIQLSDREQHRLKLFCGTPAYMAPEILRGHSYRGPNHI